MWTCLWLLLDGVCHILANLSFALPNALLLAPFALAVYFLRLRADKGKKADFGSRYIKIWAGFLIVCFV